MKLTQQALEAALAGVVGAERVKTDADSLLNFGKDWTKVYEPKPSAIVFPGNAAEVQAIVRLANEHVLALVPSGGRTGLSGGAVASNGEVVVAFDRMNRILDFNPIDRQVVCEPGVVTEQLQLFAEDKGLFYPVDFASSGSSQIGGNVATNAGAILVFGFNGDIIWKIGLTLAIANVCGGLIGVRIALRGGSGLVRKVFMAITAALILKVAFDTYTALR
jgi:hypothetical protein